MFDLDGGWLSSKGTPRITISLMYTAMALQDDTLINIYSWKHMQARLTTLISHNPRISNNLVLRPADHNYTLNIQICYVVVLMRVLLFFSALVEIYCSTAIDKEVNGSPHHLHQQFYNIHIPP